MMSMKKKLGLVKIFFEWAKRLKKINVPELPLKTMVTVRNQQKIVSMCCEYLKKFEFRMIIEVGLVRVILGDCIIVQSLFNLVERIV